MCVPMPSHALFCGVYFVAWSRTQAGMVGAAEGITDGLRRTRQLMVQVVPAGPGLVTSPVF